MGRGSLSLTAAGLMTFRISNSLMNLGANFLHPTCKGRSRADSHTYLVDGGLGATPVGRRLAERRSATLASAWAERQNTFFSRAENSGG